jgi:hypothetical protein
MRPVTPGQTIWSGLRHCPARSGTSSLPGGPTRATLVTVKRFSVMSLIATLVPVMLFGCSANQSAIACAVGMHHPPGQEGMCVTNATPAVRATLLAKTRQMARENHGVAQRVVAVESPDVDVNALLNVHGISTGNHVEWVVQAAGHFRCGSACFSAPISRHPPEKVLTLDIDSTTLEVTGLGLSNDWVNLSELGAVVVLQR